MAEQLAWECDQHDDPFECSDALIDYDLRFDEYGLIVHNGGRSVLLIQFCPWCGTRLPDSCRERWFDALEQRGIEPWSAEMPVEFEDDRWRRAS
ncbi:hypothetical protein SAMN05443668_105336 [Cryptosporangium aurantiacum]|uniref:DUF6980 domain-containing protein n=2 Tax=Cryptosporangium aurantiacum TaxID=134849 RepID=A0A1M7QTG0_9ACTN|nr:hypothetical protein [Cryptosporangium aurantiacum]SHN35013.1 hypothetical protein SAMN05443668_105336 [Cryptosporangium aurantiacum]